MQILPRGNRERGTTRMKFKLSSNKNSGPRGKGSAEACTPFESAVPTWKLLSFVEIQNKIRIRAHGDIHNLIFVLNFDELLKNRQKCTKSQKMTFCDTTSFYRIIIKKSIILGNQFKIIKKIIEACMPKIPPHFWVFAFNFKTFFNQ